MRFWLRSVFFLGLTITYATCGVFEAFGQYPTESLQHSAESAASPVGVWETPRETPSSTATAVPTNSILPDDSPSATASPSVSNTPYATSTPQPSVTASLTPSPTISPVPSEAEGEPCGDSVCESDQTCCNGNCVILIAGQKCCSLGDSEYFICAESDTCCVDVSALGTGSGMARHSCCPSGNCCFGDCCESGEGCCGTHGGVPLCCPAGTCCDDGADGATCCPFGDDPCIEESDGISVCTGCCAEERRCAGVPGDCCPDGEKCCGFSLNARCIPADRDCCPAVAEGHCPGRNSCCQWEYFDENGDFHEGGECMDAGETCCPQADERVCAPDLHCVDGPQWGTQECVPCHGDRQRCGSECCAIGQVCRTPPQGESYCGQACASSETECERNCCKEDEICRLDDNEQLFCATWCQPDRVCHRECCQDNEECVEDPQAGGRRCVSLEIA